MDGEAYDYLRQICERKGSFEAIEMKLGVQLNAGPVCDQRSTPSGGYSLDGEAYDYLRQICERKGSFEAIEMKLGVRIVRY